MIQCATWSQMAYSDKPVGQTPELTKMTYLTCEGCDAQGIIFDVTDGGALVLAVRGTTSAMDMLCDVQVLQTLFDGMPDVFVHDGFNDQFKALNGITDTRITEHLLAGGQFVCTGHSLGAGVAALFAVSYAVRFPGKVSYFGYGSPRQGNAVFSQLMSSRTLLAIIVKNQRDPVCASIPAVRLPSRYSHAGTLMMIGTDPSPGLPDPSHIRDHDIARYIQNLQDKSPGAGPTTEPERCPHSQCSIA